jgi:hypothetical protein
MEGCHNRNWVGGDPTIHLHTIVQAISMLDSFKISNIGGNKEELNNIEAVTAAEPHRFGGIEFRLNKREHGDRVADLPFPMDVRNKLVNSGRVSAHHFLPQSGWISYWIKGEQDIPNVIDLFKMRYDSLKSNTKLVTRTT